MTPQRAAVEALLPSPSSRDGVWIGLSDSGAEARCSGDDFTWADGFYAGPEQLSAYLHWAPGQPDNSNHAHGECDAGMDSDGNNM